jgi:hypothetical protein
MQKAARAYEFVTQAPYDLASGVAQGVSEFAQSWAGLGELADPERKTAVGRASGAARDALEYQPEDLGFFGKIGRFGGRVVPEAIAGVGAGAAARAGLARYAPRLGAPVIAALSSPSRAVRGGATLAVSSPFDVAQGLQYEEGMLLPGRAGSVAENVAISGLAGGLLPAGRRAARATEEVAETAPSARAVTVEPEVPATPARVVTEAAEDVPAARVPAVPTAEPSARAAELVDEWFNVPRLNLSDQAEAVFRDRAARVIQGNPDLLARRSVSFDEMRAAAREIGMRASDADIQRIVERGELKGVDILVARDLINSTSDRMAQLFSRRQELGLSESAVRVIDSQLDELGSINDALLRSVAREGSERGRSLVQMKILGQNSLDPSVWLQRAKRAVGSRELSIEEQVKINALAKAAQEGGDEALAELANEVANMQRAGIGQQASTLWKAFLLSLPRTVNVNVVGNVSHAALRTLDKPVATFYDYLISNALGTQRTTTFNNEILKASARGGKKGFNEGFVMMGGKAAREGFREGGIRGAVTAWDEAVRSGNYTSILQKYDINNRVNIEGSKTLDLIAKTVFGLQGASDMPFRTFAYEGALNEMAHVAAINSKLKRGTAEYAAAVNALYENPPDALRLAAIESAMDAVFAGNTRLASFFGGIKQYTSRLASSENPLTSLIGSGVDFFIPFTRVPSGVATEVVMHSPFGAIRATESLVDMLRANAKNLPDDVAKAQRELASSLAKTTSGSALWIAGYWMAATGLLSGRRPTSAGEAAQVAEEGGQPFAFKIGDRTYSIPKALAPIGGSLALGAVFYEVANNDDIEGLLQKSFATGTGVGSMAVETTALGGVRDIISSATDPGAAGRRVESIISTAAVPQVVAGAARAVDPTVRETDGILQSIQARIPGASRSLPARLDRFGRPITRGESVVERIGQMTDPFYSRPVRTGEDPVLAELGRVGVSAFAPRRPSRGETREDTRKKVEFEGPIIYREVGRLIRSSYYAGLPDDLRKDEIEKLISDIRSYATRVQRTSGGER